MKRLALECASRDGRARYCGPTALAVVTGVPAAEFVVPGTRRGGMSTELILRRLREHRMEGVGTGVVRFLRHARPRVWELCAPGRTALVFVRGHVLVIHGLLVFDTRSYGRLMWVHDHCDARRRVELVRVVDGPGLSRARWAGRVVSHQLHRLTA